jgi:four helix bundle protein
MIRGYMDLQVWNKSMDMVVDCYRVTQQFPRSDAWGITPQLRRAAISVPANIAEGRGRSSTREFVRFLDIAYGSLAELETQVILAERLELCGPEEARGLLTLSNEIGRMINGLRLSLRRRQMKRSANPRPLTPDP